MKCRAIIFCAVMGVMLAVASLAQAGSLAVYGSPSYNPVTGNGYMSVSVGGVSDTGVAVGSAIYYVGGSSQGTRAVQWSASGATELGGLGTRSDNWWNSEAYAINASGTAVGYSQAYDDGEYAGVYGARWNAGGTAATELGYIDRYVEKPGGWATAVNNNNVAVGYVDKYFDADYLIGHRAVRWDASGTVTELDSLGTAGTDESAYTDSRALAINNTGTAVGWAEKFDAAGNDCGPRPVRWAAGGTVATELGNLGTDGGGCMSTVSVRAINASGTAVGGMEKYDGSGNYFGVRAVRWDANGTAATELGSLGDDGTGWTASGAVAINATGTIVGYAQKFVGGHSPGQRAVRWDAGSTVATELGNLGTDSSGYTTCQANAINSSGLIVGSAAWYVNGVDMGQWHAVYWDANGNAVDLNTLIDPNSGWTLLNALSVSDTGWIAGIANYDSDGPGGASPYSRLFMVQIPEPASASLLALAGLALLRRRRAN
ncbi:MAG: DUF3466 family protein [Phycisphaerae bacterium]